MQLDDTLKERGARYGSFEDHARVAMGLKTFVANELRRRNKTLAPDQQPACGPRAGTLCPRGRTGGCLGGRQEATQKEEEKKMKTLKITKEDLDSDNRYIGQTDVSAEEFEGTIEIAPGLGQAKLREKFHAL